MDKKLFLGVAREDITPAVGTRLYGYQPNFYSEKIADNLTVCSFAF